MQVTETGLFQNISEQFKTFQNDLVNIRWDNRDSQARAYTDASWTLPTCYNTQRK